MRRAAIAICALCVLAAGCRGGADMLAIVPAITSEAATPAPTATALPTATPTDAPTVTPSVFARVRGAWNCREAASPTADIVDVLAAGRIVRVTGAFSQDGLWWLVEPVGGPRPCWVRREALDD